jgi:GNAT superfamily N-acetyltransferase
MREEHRIGHTVHVRELSTRDEPGLRAMFRRLSKATIYERFHTPYSRVPEAMLAHLMGYGDGRSLVAVAGGEIVSHALYAGEPGGEAEIVVVEDGWQSRGVGKLLLAALARKAAGRGVESYTGAVLGENRRVLGLVDAVFDGARHTLKDGSYDVSMPLRGLRSAPKPGHDIQPAA